MKRTSTTPKNRFSKPIAHTPLNADEYPIISSVANTKGSMDSDSPSNHGKIDTRTQNTKSRYTDVDHLSAISTPQLHQIPRPHSRLFIGKVL